MDCLSQLENQFRQFGLLGGRPRKLLGSSYGAVTREWLSLNVLSIVGETVKGQFYL